MHGVIVGLGVSHTAMALPNLLPEGPGARDMSQATVPGLWLHLHPVHTSKKGTSSSSSAPAPWALPKSEEAAFKLRGRHECLSNLLQRAASGNALSTAPLAPADPPAEVQPFPGPPEQGPVLFFFGGRLQAANAAGDSTISVPLLMADLVYLSATKSAESERAWYVFVLAPRPCPTKPAEDEQPSTECGDMMPLKDVWLLYTAPVEHSDFLRLLFEFGSRGALRWDLHQCYTVTDKFLGVGGSAAVYLGQSRMRLLAPKQVAVKKLHRVEGKAYIRAVRTETEVLAVASGHPFISALLGIFCFHEVGSAEGRTGPSIRWSIVVPFYENGDLFAYLAANGAMNETRATILMLCLLSALTHLHRLGVVYRDVKAEKIFLADDKAVLSGCGIAAFLKDEEAMQCRVGSPGYAAPEVVTNWPSDEKVDVFGAGVVLYFALSNTMPFPGKTLEKVLELTARCEVHYNNSLFGDISGSIMVLLKALLNKDPTMRPSAKRSFLELWTVAKPEIQRNSVACIALQAVNDFESLAAWEGGKPGPSMAWEATEGSIFSQATGTALAAGAASRMAWEGGKPWPRMVWEGGKPGPRMGWEGGKALQATGAASAAGAASRMAREGSKPGPRMAWEGNMASQAIGTDSAGADAASQDKTELVLIPVSTPKPTSIGGMFSYLRNRLAWRKSKNGSSKDDMGQTDKPVSAAKEQAMTYGRGTSNAAQVAGCRSTEGLVVYLGFGDVAEIRHGILMAMPKQLHSEFAPCFQILRDPPTPFPPGVVPLSPVLDLRPHGVNFGGQRVLLVLPACEGAEKAWRSTDANGWEEVEDVEFFPGKAVLHLEHFCAAFVGTDHPQPRRLKVRGFLASSRHAAKCAIVHANCAACDEGLQLDCEDADILGGFEECVPPKATGMYRHGEELILSQGGHWSQRVPLRFDRLPWVTSSCFSLVVQRSQFELLVDKEPHTFYLPHARAEPADLKMQSLRETSAPASSSTSPIHQQGLQAAATERVDPQVQQSQPAQQRETSALASSSTSPMHQLGLPAGATERVDLQVQQLQPAQQGETLALASSCTSPMHQQGLQARATERADLQVQQSQPVQQRETSALANNSTSPMHQLGLPAGATERVDLQVPQSQPAQQRETSALASSSTSPMHQLGLPAGTTEQVDLQVQQSQPAQQGETSALASSSTSPMHQLGAQAGATERVHLQVQQSQPAQQRETSALASSSTSPMLQQGLPAGTTERADLQVQQSQPAQQRETSALASSSTSPMHQLGLPAGATERVDLQVQQLQPAQQGETSALASSSTSPVHQLGLQAGATERVDLQVQQSQPAQQRETSALASSSTSPVHQLGLQAGATERVDLQVPQSQPAQQRETSALASSSTSPMHQLGLPAGATERVDLQVPQSQPAQLGETSALASSSTSPMHQLGAQAGATERVHLQVQQSQPAQQRETSALASSSTSPMLQQGLPAGTTERADLQVQQSQPAQQRETSALASSSTSPMHQLGLPAGATERVDLQVQQLQPAQQGETSALASSSTSPVHQLGLQAGATERVDLQVQQSQPAQQRETSALASSSTSPVHQLGLQAGATERVDLQVPQSQPAQQRETSALASSCTSPVLHQGSAAAFSEMPQEEMLQKFLVHLGAPMNGTLQALPEVFPSGATFISASGSVHAAPAGGEQLGQRLPVQEIRERREDAVHDPREEVAGYKGHSSVYGGSTRTWRQIWRPDSGGIAPCKGTTSLLHVRLWRPDGRPLRNLRRIAICAPKGAADHPGAALQHLSPTA